MMLRDRFERQDFSNVNQVLQRAMACENRAKEHRAYGRFKESNAKDKSTVNCVVAEWVDDTKARPLVCSLLKPSRGKKDCMKFTLCHEV
jgi:hypothetical protein